MSDQQQQRTLITDPLPDLQPWYTAPPDRVKDINQAGPETPRPIGWLQVGNRIKVQCPVCKAVLEGRWFTRHVGKEKCLAMRDAVVPEKAIAYGASKRVYQCPPGTYVRPEDPAASNRAKVARAARKAQSEGAEVSPAAPSLPTKRLRTTNVRAMVPGDELQLLGLLFPEGIPVTKVPDAMEWLLSTRSLLEVKVGQ